VEEGASAGVVFVVFGQALVDVGKSRADAVLVPFQGGEVDGVGEVRGQELVRFGFELGAVGGEVGCFLVSACHAFIEGSIDLGGKLTISSVADCD